MKEYKTLKRYEVEIPVSAMAIYITMAEDAEDAKKRVLDGDADSDGYSEWEEDFDSDNWIVEELLC